MDGESADTELIARGEPENDQVWFQSGRAVPEKNA